MLTKDDLQQILTILKEALSPMDKRLSRMEKKLDTTISYFDTVTTNHEHRIKRVESHLDLPPQLD